MERIETLANQYIRENLPLNTEILSLEEALKTGATAVFGERYGEEVRIVRIGDVSMELCGGTHVARTGNIGLLKIIHESSVAAGVRRIEAFTGEDAVRYVRGMENELREAANLLKANPFDLAERTEKLLRHQRDLEKEIAPLVGGSGGGRPDMAQAGGSAPENLGQALAKLQEML